MLAVRLSGPDSTREAPSQAAAVSSSTCTATESIVSCLVLGYQLTGRVLAGHMRMVLACCGDANASDKLLYGTLH
jgi:hypothetical protein